MSGATGTRPVRQALLGVWALVALLVAMGLQQSTARADATAAAGVDAPSPPVSFAAEPNSVTPATLPAVDAIGVPTTLPPSAPAPLGVSAAAAASPPTTAPAAGPDPMPALAIPTTVTTIPAASSPGSLSSLPSITEPALDPTVAPTTVPIEAPCRCSGPERPRRSHDAPPVPDLAAPDALVADALVADALLADVVAKYNAIADKVFDSFPSTTNTGTTHPPVDTTTNTSRPPVGTTTGTSRPPVDICAAPTSTIVLPPISPPSTTPVTVPLAPPTTLLPLPNTGSGGAGGTGGAVPQIAMASSTTPATLPSPATGTGGAAGGSGSGTGGTFIGGSVTTCSPVTDNVDVPVAPPLPAPIQTTPVAPVNPAPFVVPPPVVVAVDPAPIPSTVEPVTPISEPTLLQPVAPVAPPPIALLLVSLPSVPIPVAPVFVLPSVDPIAVLPVIPPSTGGVARPPPDLGPGPPPTRQFLARGVGVSQPSASPGGAAEATGSGCPATAPVTLRIDGREVGMAMTDGGGAFRVPLTVPRELGTGRRLVSAACGPVTLEGPLDVVQTSSNVNPGAGLTTLAALLSLFLLIVIVLRSTQNDRTPTQ